MSDFMQKAFNARNRGAHKYIKRILSGKDNRFPSIDEEKKFINQ